MEMHGLAGAWSRGSDLTSIAKAPWDTTTHMRDLFTPPTPRRDPSHRGCLSSDFRDAGPHKAGFTIGTPLRVLVTPGRLVLEVDHGNVMGH